MLRLEDFPPKEHLKIVKKFLNNERRNVGVLVTSKDDKNVQKMLKPERSKKPATEKDITPVNASYISTEKKSNTSFHELGVRDFNRKEWDYIRWIQDNQIELLGTNFVRLANLKDENRRLIKTFCQIIKNHFYSEGEKKRRVFKKMRPRKKIRIQNTIGYYKIPKVMCSESIRDILGDIIEVKTKRKYAYIKASQLHETYVDCENVKRIKNCMYLKTTFSNKVCPTLTSSLDIFNRINGSWHRSWQDFTQKKPSNRMYSKDHEKRCLRYFIEDYFEQTEKKELNHPLHSISVLLREG